MPSTHRALPRAERPPGHKGAARSSLARGGHKCGAEGGAAPTLYERLGGLAQITVVVSDFIDVLVPDDVRQVLAKHAVPAKETEELVAIVQSTKADIVSSPRSN